MGSRDDWFRRTKWSEAIATEFWARLRRARRKEQYLRIQAAYLTESYPEVALALLEHYFLMPDQLDQALAHKQRAEAFLTLGRTTEALDAYEAALGREADYPNSKTQ